MEVYLNQVKGKPIITLDTGGRVGSVGEAVIDPLNGKLVAFYVNNGGLKVRRVIAAIDIREISERLIIINSASDIEGQEEIVSIGKVREGGIRILGNRVQTQSGRRLGRVGDLALDARSLILAKIEARTRFFDRLPRKLLIAYDQILRIEKDAIIVKDEAIKEAVAKPVPVTQSISS